MVGSSDIEAWGARPDHWLDRSRDTRSVYSQFDVVGSQRAAGRLTDIKGELRTRVDRGIANWTSMVTLRGQATFLINGALSEYFETMDVTHIARGPADYENRVQSRAPGAVVQCVYRNQSRQESGQARAARPWVLDVAKKALRGNLHDICDQGSIVELSAYPGPVLHWVEVWRL